MTERMRADQYLALMAGGGAKRSGGKMMRLPADFVPPARTAPGRSDILSVQSAALPASPELVEPKKVSSAQKARDRVALVADANESGRTEVQYSLNPDGTERLLIRVVGGGTLPPNRGINVVRSASNMSMRTFSRYKHACADRMADVPMLLKPQLLAAGRTAFNCDRRVVQIAYGRQVTAKNRMLDEDAVVYSFKYFLDGLVQCQLLIDDSHTYVRMAPHTQRTGTQAVVLIVLTTLPADE